jgi:hypothetical protein
VTAVLHVLLPCLWPWALRPVQLGGRLTGGASGLYAYRASESQAIGIEPDALPVGDRRQRRPFLLLCPFQFRAGGRRELSLHVSSRTKS